LLLPNVWDAASARAVEAAGFPVVATSSGAVAESLGYSDHEGAPAGEMFDAVRRISRVVGVPVTVDAEAGYGLSAAELAERLAESGAVGCNIEDTDHAGGGLIDAAAQAEKLSALREAAGDELVINARIDVFLGVEDQHTVLDAAIKRAHAYLDAGADCVFPILIRSAEVLGAFTEAVSPAAVNATYLAGGPTLAELGELGIARISLGLGLWRHAKSHLEATVTALAAGTAPY
jgi:2-methylisocitrate lyase-like PEP mutase family enzyme